MSEEGAQDDRPRRTQSACYWRRTRPWPGYCRDAAQSRRGSLDLTETHAEKKLGTYIDGLEGLDILVANAGMVPPWHRIEALDLAEWDTVFALNVRGVAVSLKAAASALKASDHGAAVIMASINGYRAHPDQALYTSTKHATLGLMRAAALDLGRDGIRVNALAPGPILTDALRGRICSRAAVGGPPAQEIIAAMHAETALGRLATETDVARGLFSRQRHGLWHYRRLPAGGGRVALT